MFATLRWTKSSPGAKPTISFAGTRLSEHPIHKYCGDCCSCNRAKKCGSRSTMREAHKALLSNRRARTDMIAQRTTARSRREKAFCLGSPQGRDQSILRDTIETIVGCRAGPNSRADEQTARRLQCGR